MKGIMTLIVCSMLGTGVAGAGTALDGLTKMAGELRPAASPQGDGSEQKVPVPTAVEAAAAGTSAPNLDSLRAEIARMTVKLSAAMERVSDTWDEVKTAQSGVEIAQSHSSDLLFGLAGVVEAQGKLMTALSRANATIAAANGVAVDLQTVYTAYFRAANLPLHPSVLQCLEREGDLVQEAASKKRDAKIALEMLQEAQGLDRKLECISRYISAQAEFYNAQMDLLVEIVRCIKIMRVAI